MIGEKSSGFMIAIALFALMWGIILALCIAFYASASGLLLLVAIVAGIFLLLCIWQAINYFMTPDEPVKADKDTLYFWSARKWHELKLDEIDEVRTNSQMTHTFTTMRSIMDRGVLRIFDRRNNLFRVRYLYHPEEIKVAIKELIKDYKAQTENNTDNSVNTNNTDL